MCYVPGMAGMAQDVFLLKFLTSDLFMDYKWS